MVTVRPARIQDGPLIARMRAASWRAAYDGIIPAGILAHLTAPAAVAREAAWRSRHLPRGLLIAESAGPGGSGGEPAGFAAVGPQRGADGRPGPAPGQAEPGTARAELYAIYVVPQHWSTGAGRALMEAALDWASAARYEEICLWVLAENARARRFYERAGFTRTGESEVRDDLGAVTEIRYRRPLS